MRASWHCGARPGTIRWQRSRPGLRRSLPSRRRGRGRSGSAKRKSGASARKGSASGSNVRRRRGLALPRVTCRATTTLPGAHRNAPRLNPSRFRLITNPPSSTPSATTTRFSAAGSRPTLWPLTSRVGATDRRPTTGLSPINGGSRIGRKRASGCPTRGCRITGRAQGIARH